MASTGNVPEVKNAAVRRNANQKFFIFILVSGIVCFSLAAGALYFALRPQTLRIAVGPPKSDDTRLIEAMTRTFVSERSHVRLSPVVTDGAIESISLLRQSTM